MTNILNRRAALGSIAAAGAMLAVPRVSKADTADAEHSLHSIASATYVKPSRSRTRHSALERLCPGPESVPALIAKAGDQTILRVPVDDPPIVESEPLNGFHVHAGESCCGYSSFAAWRTAIRYSVERLLSALCVNDVEPPIRKATAEHGAIVLKVVDDQHPAGVIRDGRREKRCFDRTGQHENSRWRPRGI
jgi:hypothetical protein